MSLAQERKYIQGAISTDLTHIAEVYFGRNEPPKGNFWVVVEATEGGVVSSPSDLVD